MSKKRVGIIVSTFLLLVMLLVIGPLDVFTHGYYCDVVEYNQIQSFEGEISLESGYKMEFSPAKDHFAGFKVNLTNQIQDNTGILKLVIFDVDGKELETIQTALNEITEHEWYCLYLDTTLKRGEVYSIQISVEDCEVVPSLLVVDDEYLTREDIGETGVLIGYAYAESTFTPQNKVLISLLLISIWGFVCTAFVENVNVRRHVRYVSGFVLLTTILAWNFMYSSMDKDNTQFRDFQRDSETLVSGIIVAEHNNVWSEARNSIYGLGRYADGDWSHEETFRMNLLTEGEWKNGYSQSRAAIKIKGNEFLHLKKVVSIGNSIEFSNGDRFLIVDVQVDGPYYVIFLDANIPLKESKYGSLSEILFYDVNGEAFTKGSLTPYSSQYGLQGKIFRHIAKFMDYEDVILNLNLLCAILTAGVFVAIVYLLAGKYNARMAGCFFVTFWLSPWIVNFARNLYWVEFTWFIPMAVGILCAWKVNNWKCRIFCYVAIYLSIVVKCLCGYEYISSIMMSAIVVLVGDLVKQIVEKEYTQVKILFKTILLLGSAAMLGFITAICIHAFFRGDGDVMIGLRSIVERDVLRRTHGGSLNEFSSGNWPSLNASVWDVLCKYMKLPTEVVTGLPGNTFPLICILPCFIFIFDVREKKLNLELVVMYVMFLLTTISWLCLAKSHSYIHTNMNYVLWYMGFVQICFYIIIEFIGRVFKINNDKKSVL